MESFLWPHSSGQRNGARGMGTRWSLQEEFVGDALRENFASRIDLSVCGFNDAVTACERIVGYKFECRAGFGVQRRGGGRDKLSVGGVEADAQVIRADGPFECGANQVDHGFGMSGQCALEETLGDRDTEPNCLCLALVEPAVSLGVQLFGGGVQHGECRLHARIDS